MGKLTATRVQALKEPGRYGDGGGLHLVIRPSGTKAWVQRIVIDGRRRDIGLGGFPVVGLATAREKAMEYRRAVADGRDPVADTKKAALPTFGEATDKYLKINQPRWKNPKTGANFSAVLGEIRLPCHWGNAGGPH